VNPGAGDEGAGNEGAVTFCAGCGQPVGSCAGCLPPDDPPHYCQRCGRWMAVRVRTAGWVARCPEHGQLTSEDVRPAGR
jgi:hypothetical protein